MIIRIGNFLFRYRNGLFPLVYLLLLIRGPALFSKFGIAEIVGFTIALLGQTLRGLTVGLDYIIRGGRKRTVYAERLVQGGLFAHCRNPLYLGNLMIVLGLGIAANSLLFLAVGFPLFVFAYLAIIAAEENFLRGKFGEEFKLYCQRVNRFLPKLAGLGSTLSGSTFNWRRLISAEYGTAFAWVVTMILLFLRNRWIAGNYDLASFDTRALWLMLLFAAFTYACARFLKKTGRLDSTKPLNTP
jgi:protein-S-isoprenylcysteine O-methyltransferase Ste14